MNKPLTKEEREQYGAIAATCQEDVNPLRHRDPELGKLDSALHALARTLKAEAYWREALKTVDPVEYWRDPNLCDFCDKEITVGGDSISGHAADCPWLLAQE